MRTKAILILIGFLLIIGVICFFWANSFLEWSLEQSLQAVIGAKVDVERFQLDPINLAVRIGNIQITNPADTWKNLIDTKNISFKLAPVPLYEGKTVIDEIIVEDLTFNAPRKTDGKLNKKVLPGKLGKSQSKLQQSIAKMPILNPETITKNLDTEKLTASYRFETDLSAERINEELNDYQKKWDANVKELENIKGELKSLDGKTAQIKNLDSKNLLELKEQLKLIQDTQSSLKDIRSKIKTTDDQFKKDNHDLEKTVKGLKEEAEADYRSLLALAKVPDLGSINYAEALLGKPLVNASTTVLKIADEIQKSLPVKVDNPPKEKHPRGGQDIAFPGRKTFPRFLIKKIAISGKGTPSSSMDGFYGKGIVNGITSEPPIYGLPITVDVFGKTSNQAYLKLDGQINHISPAFRDKINLKLENLPLPGIDFPGSDYLPTKIISGKAEIDAVFQMTPDSMNLNVLLTGNNIKSDFTGKQAPGDLVSEIVRKSLSGLDHITVNYQLVRTQDQLEMKVTSNLNQVITDGLKETVGEKMAGFTKELRAKVDAKLLKNQQALESAKLQYQKEITNKLDEVQMQLNKEEQNLEAKKKELEVKIQKELNKLKLKL